MPRALFTAKAEAAVVQTINKPLKAHRHFHQLATQRVDHTVNHSGRDQRFTHRDLFAPLRTVLEEIIDCNSRSGSGSSALPG